jgi:hypothetical protein
MSCTQIGLLGEADEEKLEVDEEQYAMGRKRFDLLLSSFQPSGSISRSMCSGVFYM